MNKFHIIERKISNLENLLRVPDDFKREFPGGFEGRFARALDRENRELTEIILSEASNSAEQAFCDFESAITEGLKRADIIFKQIFTEVERQTREIESNWSEKYDDFPDPGENYAEDPERGVAEKYVIYSGRGTVNGLDKVLSNAKSHLELLEGLGDRFDRGRKELSKFKIDENLKDILGGVGYKVPAIFTREESYELSPPTPVKSDPGLSVYHEVEIEDVVYEREDPVGLVHSSAPPTPIYLWFLGVTLWWAQWHVKIVVDEPLVEEIFDYRNQTIPQPIDEGSRKFVHKPLPYRQEFQESNFDFRLIVVSLRNFQISSD